MSAADATSRTRTRAEEILQQTNKRITLNLLIQGAGVHTALTSHYLVRDELEAIRPGLTRLYDKAMTCMALNYFIGDMFLFYGLPSWFWRRTHRPKHLYHHHRLLATHGRELWRASKRYLMARGWRKWIVCVPVLHWFQMMWLVARMSWVEGRNKIRLAEVAKKANALIWNIDAERTDAALTSVVAFGNIQEPKSAVGRLVRAGVVGYGGVRRENGQFKVVARAWNFPLVSHELIKGTAELVCLHGLNSLDDEVYHLVTDEADRIEYETWMIQAGSELWRRFLAAVPDNKTIPEALMHVARLDPEPLEQLMMIMVEDPEKARPLLAAI